LIGTLIDYFSIEPNPFIYALACNFLHTHFSSGVTQFRSEESAAEETALIFGARLMRFNVSNFPTVCMRLFCVWLWVLFFSPHFFIR